MNNGADVFAFHQTDENVGVHDATEMTFANATDVTRDVEYGNDADRAVEGDAYATETTYNSYGSNLKNSCSGALFGLLLFFGSFGLLIYNEGRTVKRAKDIDEGQKLVTTLNLGDFTNATSEISKYEGMLVHVVGDLSTTDTLIDPIFGVGPNLSTSSRKTGSLENMPLKLSRRISMYQWVESTSTKTIKSSNGQTITSTDYQYVFCIFHVYSFKNGNRSHLDFIVLIVTKNNGRLNIINPKISNTQQVTRIPPNFLFKVWNSQQTRSNSVTSVYREIPLDSSTGSSK